MDRPTNLMMICGVLSFGDPIRIGAAARRRSRSVSCAFPRFRQRPVDCRNRRWEADEKLDLDYHVVRVSLPGRAGKARAEALVSRLAATELDPAHPLWQYHLVDNYDGGSALASASTTVTPTASRWCRSCCR